MENSADIDILAQGLRTLRVLARNAPLDLPAFALANGLAAPKAAALMGAFEHGGYVRRIPHGGLYVLTPLALDVVGDAGPAGILISRALDPVVALGRTFGHPVTLSIRRGAEMVCCVASHDPDRAGHRPGEALGVLECLPGLVHLAFSENGKLDPAMERIRRNGHGLDVRADGSAALAVPVLADGRVSAVLALHFSARPAFDPLTRWLHGLKRVARRLGATPDSRAARRNAARAPFGRGGSVLLH